MKIESGVELSGVEVKGDAYNESRNFFRHARIAAGLCRDCGKLPPIENKVVCRVCSERRTRNGIAHRKNRLAEGRCQLCGTIERKGKHLCTQCSGKSIESFRQRRKENKLVVIAYFGNNCVRCNESDPRVLTLHHINGDGATDRKTKSGKRKISTPTFYARLARAIRLKQPIKVELELLCSNCHFKIDLAPWWLQ